MLRMIDATKEQVAEFYHGPQKSSVPTAPSSPPHGLVHHGRVSDGYVRLGSCIKTGEQHVGGGDFDPTAKNGVSRPSVLTP
jgi:hypothetical protein